MVNKKYIKEALHFQDLTEEEKQRRGILGRLYGPCASIVDATRNGRLYSDELWEKVFNENEIVKEMLENGGCPMELDHPVDREETCSEKIAAMLPEAPKRDKDGHLICYIDLIDTPCGRIAYQLAKYGFNLGISSRGTGDLVTDANGNESVDPDTYDFTTFDLVLLPAVKDARLSMCESYDTKLNKFKKALTESYKESSVEDKRIMEDTLKDLDIELEPENEIDITDIPMLADEAPDLLTEDAENEEDVSEETEEETEENTVEEEESEKESEKAEEEVETTAATVKDLIKEIGEYDDDLNVEFAPIVINDKEYTLSKLEFDPSEEGKLVISIGYDSEMSDNIENQEDNSEEFEAEEAAEEPVEVELEVPAEEADDVEIDGMIESLKEAVRQKDSLEEELKTLKSEKAVSNAEVEKLREDLDRYKMAFARTSEIATNAKKFESEIKNLTEALNQKDVKIKQLAAVKNNTAQLTESRDANAAKVKTLTEKLNTVKADLETAENQLNEQAATYRKQLKERTELAKTYRSKFEKVLEHYVATKASMLGVRPAEIINRLNENYSLEDVDKIYDQLLTEGTNMSRVPGLGNVARVKVNESKSSTTSVKKVAEGYDIDESLLELAGLK